MIKQTDYKKENDFIVHSSLQEVAKRANEFARAGRNNLTLTSVEGEQPEIEEAKPRTREVKWRQGDMEFEAYMRMLDNSVHLLFFFK